MHIDRVLKRCDTTPRSRTSSSRRLHGSRRRGSRSLRTHSSISPSRRPSRSRSRLHAVHMHVYMSACMSAHKCARSRTSCPWRLRSYSIEPSILMHTHGRSMHAWEYHAHAHMGAWAPTGHHSRCSAGFGNMSIWNSSIARGPARREEADELGVIRERSADSRF